MLTWNQLREAPQVGPQAFAEARLQKHIPLPLEDESMSYFLSSPVCVFGCVFVGSCDISCQVIGAVVPADQLPASQQEQFR